MHKSNSAMRGIMLAFAVNYLTVASALATLWAMSLGSVTLPQQLENDFTASGVAIAIDFFCILCGMSIRDYDSRIYTLERRGKGKTRQAIQDREILSQIKRDRTEQINWFKFIGAISAISSIIFRYHWFVSQYPLYIAIPAALFIGIVPIILIYAFTIKLRPLPYDHMEVATETVSETLIVLSHMARKSLMRVLAPSWFHRNITQQDKEQAARAVAVLQTTVGNNNATLQLNDMAHQFQLIDAPTVDGEYQEMLTIQQLMEKFTLSERAAQLWANKIVGSQKTVNGWLVPEKAAQLYAQTHARKPKKTLSQDSGNIEKDDMRDVAAQLAANQTHITATQAQLSA